MIQISRFKYRRVKYNYQKINYDPFDILIFYQINLQI